MHFRLSYSFLMTRQVVIATKEGMENIPLMAEEVEKVVDIQATTTTTKMKLSKKGENYNHKSTQCYYHMKFGT